MFVRQTLSEEPGELQSAEEFERKQDKVRGRGLEGRAKRGSSFRILCKEGRVPGEIQQKATGPEIGMCEREDRELA